VNFSNSFRGINANGLKNLSISMLEFEEDFNKIFTEVTNVVNKINSNLAGDVSTSFNESFKELSQNFPVVSNSMKTYSDDFITVIRNYEKQDMSQSDLYRR